MSDTGHTPLPWFAEYATGYIFSRPHPLTRFVIASTESGSEAEQRANAAYIVTACNALPILVEALREAVGCLYACRYSEVPLAQKLDAILKEQTGKTYGEHIMEDSLASIKGGDNA